MNKAAKAIIQNQIDFLTKKCADLSVYFNSDLTDIHCGFRTGIAPDGEPEQILISTMDMDAFKHFIQTVYVRYDKELRDLQTFLAEQSPAPEPGPIIKTHVSEDPGQDPAEYPG